MKPLTKNQQVTLHILEEYFHNNGHAPSLSELTLLLQESGIAIKTRRSAVQYLESLEQKGYIQRDSSDRGITLLSHASSENFLDIPLYGTANAGSPLAFAEDNIQGFLKISKKLLKSVQNVFALQVSGDSMNKCSLDNKKIEDGDFVVIDRTISEYKNNDIVLAIVDGCATIKKFKKTLFNEIILFPESFNSIHQPIYIHEEDSFFLNGKVISLLKSAKNL
jgi:SOS regulatory protein LexA